MVLARTRSSCAAAFFFVTGWALASPCLADPLENNRTTGGVQGMFEVRAAAHQFLERQASPGSSRWLALLPDARTFVPACAVPLGTRWAVAADHEAALPGVIVSCPRSTHRNYPTWNAFVGARSVPVAEDPLLRYRSTAQVHGLYEIQAEASRFLRHQPQKKTGPWIAAGPDIRMQVPRCTVPLRMRWARASDRTEYLPGVLVICRKTVNRKDPSWSIFLGAYVEAERKLEVQRRFPGFKDDRASESK
jgi:hypothetical protein